MTVWFSASRTSDARFGTERGAVRTLACRGYMLAEASAPELTDQGRTRFVTALDGVKIAWPVSGRGGAAVEGAQLGLSSRARAPQHTLRSVLPAARAKRTDRANGSTWQWHVGLEGAAADARRDGRRRGGGGRSRRARPLRALRNVAGSGLLGGLRRATPGAGARHPDSRGQGHWQLGHGRSRFGPRLRGRRLDHPECVGLG